MIGALRGLAGVASRGSAKGVVSSIDDVMIGLGRKANRGRQKLSWIALDPKKIQAQIQAKEKDLRALTHTKAGKPRTTIPADSQKEIERLKGELDELRAKKKRITERIRFAEKGSVRGKAAQEREENFAKGVGYGVTEAAMFGAPIAAGLALSPVRSAREYITQDNFEDNLSRQMLPQQMGAMVMSREQNRMRQIQSNLKRLASADPQIAAALMAGRHLPQNASVFGGQPRTDLMMALGEAMEQGRTAAPPDPLLEMM